MATDMQAVLEAMMSTDNAQRNAAESYYSSQLVADPQSTTFYLLKSFCAPTLSEINRSFAGILLRRAVEQFSKHFSADFVNHLRQELIKLWSMETNMTIMRRLSHIMAQSALSSSWADLIPSVLASGGNLQGKALVPAVGLIDILAEYCPSDIMQHLETIGQFLVGNLNSSEPQVQTACAKAIGACIIAIEDDNARAAFKPALETIINVVGNTLSRGDEVDATSIIERLVDVAQCQPVYFKDSLEVVSNAMVTVCNSPSLEFSTRAMAMELLVSFAETIPALVRKTPSLIQNLVPTAFALMLEVELDDQEFSREKYCEELADENCTVGDEAIERLTAGLGGKSVSVHVLGKVQQWATSGNWVERRAAVAAISRLAEGSSKHFLKNFFDQVLSFLANAVQDASMRVRFEAIQAVGQFALLFPDRIGVLVSTFLPLLTTTLQHAGNSCDRVRGHAASALINLLNPDNCESEMIEAALQPLLMAMAQCIETAPLEIKAPCLSAVG